MTQEETCSGQNHDVYLSIVVSSQKIKHSTDIKVIRQSMRGSDQVGQAF